MLNYIFIDEFLNLVNKCSNNNFIIDNELFNQYYIEFTLKHIEQLNKIIYKKENKKGKNIRLTLYELKL